jgi:hypothetical protein
MAEKPFLSPRNATSIDIGIHSLTFTYHYLLILLPRSSSSSSSSSTFNHFRTQCLSSSKQLLHLLDNLVADSTEPYIGMIWLLLCDQFTPFLELFGEIDVFHSDGWWNGSRRDEAGFRCVRKSRSF